MAAGCGAARSWGRAVVGCAAAEVSRFPTECAGDALAQLVGSEPGRNKNYYMLIKLWADTALFFRVMA
jgi:hypothetical protein